MLTFMALLPECAWLVTLNESVLVPQPDCSQHVGKPLEPSVSSPGLTTRLTPAEAVAPPRRLTDAAITRALTAARTDLSCRHADRRNVLGTFIAGPPSVEFPERDESRESECLGVCPSGKWSGQMDLATGQGW